MFSSSADFLLNGNMNIGNESYLLKYCYLPSIIILIVSCFNSTPKLDLFDFIMSKSRGTLNWSRKYETHMYSRGLVTHLWHVSFEYSLVLHT